MKIPPPTTAEEKMYENILSNIKSTEELKMPEFNLKNLMPEDVQLNPVPKQTSVETRWFDIAEQMNFCLGNAIKCIWRCHEPGGSIEDLKKAICYLNHEIDRMNRQSQDTPF